MNNKRCNQMVTTEETVFRKFSITCKIGISLDSIKKREPPEPDILCCTRNGESIAFELVELIDQSFAKRTYDQLGLKDLIERSYENLPSTIKETIDTKLSDALLSISFRNNVSLTQKQKVVKDILPFLGQAPGGYVGDLPLSGNVGKIIARITILRSDFVGPCFDVEAVGSLADPAYEKLSQKFNKKYASQFPIELLAYYDLQPIFPTSSWLPRVESYVEKSLHSSMFRRVWFYDIHKGNVIYIFPKLT